MSKEHPLDNMGWNSLTTTHRHLGVIGKKAARYRTRISMIAGIAENTPEAFDELAELAEPGVPVALLGNPPPEGHPAWMIGRRAEAYQMVIDAPIEYEDKEFVPLTPEDVPEMMALVELTQPGPFSPGTIEMGDYIGIKVDGKLVAMGGERMKPEGHIEVSGICTHPDHRGKGYAKAITGYVTNAIFARGETPFLNVFHTNTPAINLYEKLGYKKRMKIKASGIIRKPSA
jgi:ribosomal protein S18 acetylase RimI-like enzyme